jgi:membrane protein YdbS with pleckstrin-like domain
LKDDVKRASRWIYQGVWAGLVRWFRVPPEPPTLPIGPAESAYSFRPAESYLRYLLFQFWLGMAFPALGLTVAAIAVGVGVPLLGLAIFPLEVILLALPGIVGLIAIYLRYDTTWYVMTSRSLRIRRGIWIIHETTISFENVQNVTVNQGPLQRYFRIADVVVETAGGGSGQSPAQPGHGISTGHTGLLEGVENAQEIRDLILSRLKQSKSAGLGDEAHTGAGAGWTAGHLGVLREISELTSALAARARPANGP